MSFISCPVVTDGLVRIFSVSLVILATDTHLIPQLSLLTAGLCRHPLCSDICVCSVFLQHKAPAFLPSSAGRNTFPPVSSRLGGIWGYHAWDPTEAKVFSEGLGEFGVDRTSITISIWSRYVPCLGSPKSYGCQEPRRYKREQLL